MKKHNEKHHEGRKTPVEEGYPIEEEGKEEGGPAGMSEEAREAADPEALRKEMDSLRAELEKAKAESRENKDKFLRLYADTENFKKRMSRDVTEQARYANEGLIKEILPVLDNLERAIAHAAEQSGQQGQCAEGLIDGVKMVAKQLTDVLMKFGVTQVESVGKPFDPNKHQAMMHVETDKHEPGTVVEEFQKGYFLNDRILRPAMVTVAKAPSNNPSNEA